MVYNLTFMDNVTGPVGLLTGLGAAISQPNLVGHLILFVFFIIFMIFSIRYDFTEVFLVDSFLTTVLAILLWSAGLIAASSIAYPGVMFFLGLVFLLIKK